MRFILGPNKLINLDELRNKYQKEKGIILDAPPSFFKTPTALGGTNIPARKSQITLIEKMRIILNANTFKEEHIKTNAELEAYLTSARVLLATVLYIQSQIGKSKRRSVLYRLLEDELGVSESNQLDEEDQEICFLAAKRIVAQQSFLEQANTALRDAKAPILTENEWANFKDFLISKSSQRLVNDPYADYPVTNVTQKLFGAAGAYAGATIGMLSGEVISHSTKALSTKTQLSAVVGGTLLVFRSAGPAGVALFAPAIAERLINSFCSISLAHMLGISMGIVGKGVGIGVGMSLDIAYKLLCAIGSTISTRAYSSPTHGVSGIRIKDGMTVLHGIPLEVSSLDSILAKYKDVKIIDIREGNLYIDDQLIKVPETGRQMPKELIDALKSHLSIDLSSLAENEHGTIEPGMQPGVEIEQIEGVERPEGVEYIERKSTTPQFALQ